MPDHKFQSSNKILLYLHLRQLPFLQSQSLEPDLNLQGVEAPFKDFYFIGEEEDKGGCDYPSKLLVGQRFRVNQAKRTIRSSSLGP